MYNRIISSVLDTDWYKFTMQQVIKKFFGKAEASYKFINRGEHKFDYKFKEELMNQIEHLNNLCSNYDEMQILCHQELLSYEYINAVPSYFFDKNNIKVSVDNGNLNINIEGNWSEVMMWEIPLLAIISELYFKDVKPFLSERKMQAKCEFFEKHDIKFVDFGTRRRFSKQNHQNILEIATKCRTFQGTSNVMFSNIFNIPLVGTYAHEAVMGTQGYIGPKCADLLWMTYWKEMYGNKLDVALPDTFTTPVCIKYAGNMLSKFDGVRHDSGNPYEFGHRILKFYRQYDINPLERTIVFSDNIKWEVAKQLNDYFKNKFGKVIFGIGTHLTNDCGVTPLNMVIKLDKIKHDNSDWTNVVKLSDDNGKYTGNTTAIGNVCGQLGIAL